MRHVSFERDAIESLVQQDKSRPFELKAITSYLVDGVAAEYIGSSESSLFPYRVAAFALRPVEGARFRMLPLNPLPCDGAVLFRPVSADEAKAGRGLNGFVPSLVIEGLEIVASDDVTVSFRRVGRIRLI